MDEKEFAIIAVLTKENKLQFSELFRLTKAICKMHKSTFVEKLKKLVRNGDVKHVKKFYFLVALTRRKQYKDINKKLVTYEKTFEKYKDGEFVLEQIRVLNNLFEHVYSPLQYERLCFWSNYIKSEQHVLKNIINRSEKLIVKISDNIKKYVPEPEHLLPPGEIIVIKKISNTKKL